MNLNDKIRIGEVEYTIWLIEGTTYHLRDDQGNGICCEIDYLNTINNNNDNT